MQDKEVNILSTRPLDPSLIQRSAKVNILIDSFSFITTDPVCNEELKNQVIDVSREPGTVVFTSMNAAEAVIAYLKYRPDHWKIFCLGSTTKDIVTRHFGADLIASTANNASSLADEIIKSKVRSVIFFCGDQRRNELPDKLAFHNISVKEIVVYKTSLSPQKMQKDYAGILFFSPSAVKSFFSVNIISAETLLFAIGTTTADCVRQFCTNIIVESDLPGKEQLVEKAIAHFRHKSTSINEHTKK